MNFLIDLLYAGRSAHSLQYRVRLSPPRARTKCAPRFNHLYRCPEFASARPLAPLARHHHSEASRRYSPVFLPIDPLQNDFGAMFQAPGISLGSARFFRSRRVVETSLRFTHGLMDRFGSSIFGTTCAVIGGIAPISAVELSYPAAPDGYSLSFRSSCLPVSCRQARESDVILAIPLPMIPRAALVLRSALWRCAKCSSSNPRSRWVQPARIISAHMPNVMAPI